MFALVQFLLKIGKRSKLKHFTKMILALLQNQKSNLKALPIINNIKNSFSIKISLLLKSHNNFPTFYYFYNFSIIINFSTSISHFHAKFSDNLSISNFHIFFCIVAQIEKYMKWKWAQPFSEERRISWKLIFN